MASILDNTNLLYLFSALAQCAAAFAALVAVFGVFRFQANASELANLFSESRYHLSHVHSARALDFPKSEVIRRLRDLDIDTAARQDLRPRAIELHKRITQIEEMDDRFPNEVGKLLKFWTLIFLFSIAMCSVTHLYAPIGSEFPWQALTVTGMALALTSIAVLQTSQFVQICLGRTRDQ